MAADQLAIYLHALLSSLTINVVIPLLLFAALLLPIVWVLWRAQRRADFDASQFLRDEHGRLSSVRLFAGFALAVSSWVVAVETVNARLTFEGYAVYLITWSGSLVLARFADKWDGALPFGGRRGGPTE